MQQKINQAESVDFKNKWKMLVDNIVRPPRKIYRESQLGTKQFFRDTTRFVRQDMTIPHDNKQINLSIFRSSVRKYVILYLHSNASNKLQSTQLLPYIPEGFSLASFDFFACGLNQMEDTITLGVREAQQTKTVVEHLRNLKYRVVLWGRSMGAVTALLYGDVEIIVADSPFLSFKQTCKKLTYKYTPKFLKPCVCCLFNCFYLKLKSDIKKRANYNVDELNIQKAVTKINDTTTIIFLSALNDQVISPDTCNRLFQIFKGKSKYLEICQGTHNSRRPHEVIKRIMNIVEQNLITGNKKLWKLTQLPQIYNTLEIMKY